MEMSQCHGTMPHTTTRTGYCRRCTQTDYHHCPEHMCNRASLGLDFDIRYDHTAGSCSMAHTTPVETDVYPHGTCGHHSWGASKDGTKCGHLSPYPDGDPHLHTTYADDAGSCCRPSTTAAGCSAGYNYCPGKQCCDINGGCECDDCCGGNGCHATSGLPIETHAAEPGFMKELGCSYQIAAPVTPTTTMCPAHAPDLDHGKVIGYSCYRADETKVEGLFEKYGEYNEETCLKGGGTRYETHDCSAMSHYYSEIITSNPTEAANFGSGLQSHVLFRQCFTDCHRHEMRRILDSQTRVGRRLPCRRLAENSSKYVEELRRRRRLHVI